MNGRKWNEYESGEIFGLKSEPEENHSGQKSLLILLHGRRSNETALQEDAETIAPGSTLLSLRGPVRIGRIAFAWFNVKSSSETGSVYDIAEVLSTQKLLEEEIQKISLHENIPLHRIFVLGFSQGAILTLGLYLQGELTLGGYLACSGRTLPEFADFARKKGKLAHDRAIFLAHGKEDTTIPLSLAHETQDLMSS